MNKVNNPLSRKNQIVVQEMDGEILIYDLKDDKAFCLNEASALVWQMCDGNNSVSEIARRLSKKLNSPANENLVWMAIDQLKKENLIANGHELPNNFEGMNRREVIKKVGLASMIALPIVVGLVAPTAVHAASVCRVTVACSCPNGTGSGNSCTNTATCGTTAGCVCGPVSCNGGGNNCNGTCRQA